MSSISRTTRRTGAGIVDRPRCSGTGDRVATHGGTGAMTHQFRHCPLSASQAMRWRWLAHALVAVAGAAFVLMIVSGERLMVSLYAPDAAFSVSGAALPVVLAWVAGVCGQVGANMYIRLRPLQAGDIDEMHRLLADAGQVRTTALVQSWFAGGEVLRKRDLQAVRQLHGRILAEREHAPGQDGP